MGDKQRCSVIPQCITELFQRRHTNTVSILFQEITSDPRESHLYLGGLEISFLLFKHLYFIVRPLVLIATTTWFVVCLAI